jgi:hypothetical protein
MGKAETKDGGEGGGAEEGDHDGLEGPVNMGAQQHHPGRSIRQEIIQQPRRPLPDTTHEISLHRRTSFLGNHVQVAPGGEDLGRGGSAGIDGHPVEEGGCQHDGTQEAGAVLWRVAKPLSHVPGDIPGLTVRLCPEENGATRVSEVGRWEGRGEGPKVHLLLI